MISSSFSPALPPSVGSLVSSGLWLSSGALSDGGVSFLGVSDWVGVDGVDEPPPQLVNAKTQDKTSARTTTRDMIFFISEKSFLVIVSYILSQNRMLVNTQKIMKRSFHERIEKL